jgi:hypothetical protein
MSGECELGKANGCVGVLSDADTIILAGFELGRFAYPLRAKVTTSTYL